MKVVATQDGIALVLTDTERQTISKYSTQTEYTARQVLEAMASMHSANFEEDVKSAIETLDEAMLDDEASHAE